MCIVLEWTCNGVPTAVELTCFNDRDEPLTVEAINPFRQIFYVEEGVQPLEIEAGGEAVLELNCFVEETGRVAASPIGIEFAIEEYRGYLIVSADEFEVLKLGPLVADPIELNLELWGWQNFETSVTLSNRGEMDIEWHLEFQEDYAWFSVEPIVGNIEPRDDIDLVVSVNTYSLPLGIHQGQFEIINTTLEVITVMVNLDVINSADNTIDPIS